jgi:hypothetical protein
VIIANRRHTDLFEWGQRTTPFSLAAEANANDAVEAHAAAGRFVTGQVLRIDLHTGTAQIVDAGHPFPLRLRDDEVTEVELDSTCRSGSSGAPNTGCRPSSCGPGTASSS